MNSSTDNSGEINQENQVQPSTPQPSLKKNFVFNFISQVLILIIPLITAPYLARILGAEVNGQISFATSISTYFTLFASFGFTSYGQREIARLRDDKHRQTLVFYEIVFLRLIFTVVSLAVMLILVFANTFDEKYKTFILIQSLTVLSCAVDPTFYYQGVEDFKSIAIKQILIKICGLIFIFVLVKTADDAWLYVLFNAGATLLASIIMWPAVIKKSDKFSLKELNIKKHLLPSFLIFLPSLAVTIYAVLDKTMIGLLATNADYENGCYEQAYKLNNIILIVTTVLSTVMIPRNTYHYATGNMDGLKKNLLFSTNYIWLVGTPLICGVAVLAPSLCSWFLGEGYDEVPLLLQIMSVRFIASGFGVMFGNELFTAIGKEKYVTIATFAGAAINLVTNIFFIQLWGALGAAITTAMSEFLVTFILMILCFKKKFLSPKELFIPGIKKIIASLIMFTAIFFINKLFSYTIWSFLLITLIGCVIYAIVLLLLRDRYFISLLQKGIEIVKKKLHRNKKVKEEN